MKEITLSVLGVKFHIKYEGDMKHATIYDVNKEERGVIPNICPDMEGMIMLENLLKNELASRG